MLHPLGHLVPNLIALTPDHSLATWHFPLVCTRPLPKAPSGYANISRSNLDYGEKHQLRDVCIPVDLADDGHERNETASMNEIFHRLSLSITFTCQSLILSLSHLLLLSFYPSILPCPTGTHSL